MSELPTLRRRGGGRFLMSGLVGVLLAAGCSSSPEETPAADGVLVMIRVADQQLRHLDDPCSGTGPFRSVHAGATFEVTRHDGATVATGTLSGGRAIKTMDADFRGIREPTDCVLDALITGVTDVSGLSVAIADHGPIPVTFQESGEPRVLMR